MVSDRAGDVDGGPDRPHGLFFKDTRFLSRWLLTMKTDFADLFEVKDALEKQGETYREIQGNDGSVDRDPPVAIGSLALHPAIGASRLDPSRSDR